MSVPPLDAPLLLPTPGQGARLAREPRPPRGPRRPVREPMPLVAVYTASKTAIEGFTGSLAHELAEFGVQVKLVEPGYGPATRFTENGMPRMQGLIPEAYAPYAQRIFSAFAQTKVVTTAADVAEVVWTASNDTSARLHFAAGPDAVALANVA